MTQANFIGVGVGPGDPELITLKAARLIQQADAIAYIANEKGESQAKKIAAQVIAEGNREQEDIAVVMPMCDNRDIANQVYDSAAQKIQDAINNGKQVVFLCEGDPLFFGSFAYLMERLENSNSCEVVPGISSVHSASAALKIPLTMLKESFAVVSGRHTETQLKVALENHDSVVIMKAGRSRQKIIQALRDTHRLEDAHYLEYIGRENEKIINDLEQLDNEAGPYFSLFVVTKKAEQRQ